jgi:hypothetical protein
MQRVINFSGGKTSAYMTIEEYKEGDLVIFCDTGREHPKTYKFINDFEANENIPIIRLKYYDNENPFRYMLEKRKFKLLPYRQRRFCTDELKIKTCKRYLRNIGIQKFESLIGFRYDEEHRVKRHNNGKFKKVIYKYPLYDKKINKSMINDYWSKKSYTLEIPSILGNCTLCFMKGKNAIMAILREFPELADEWIKDEELAKNSGIGKGNKTYFEGISLIELRNISQNNLFKDYNLNEIKPAFDCACTS